MSGIYVLMATAVLGIDYGWERDSNGNIEYIIRLEPQTVDALKSGNDISSALPPTISRVRSYRLTTSTAPLPHQGELPTEPAGEASQPATPAAAMNTSPTSNSGVVQANHETPVPSLPPDTAEGPTLGPASGTGSEQKVTELKGTEQKLPQKPISLLTDRQATENSVAIPRHSVARPQSPAREDSGSPSDAVPPGVDPNGQTPERPWWPLTLCLLGLFASLGGNVFLGWVTADQRGKYRAWCRD